jgi:hypothetical protein
MRLGKFRRPETSAPARRRYRPMPERLEDRDVPTTLCLVPHGVPLNHTHFHTFQSAYQAAQTGDVIQVEPGADVASVGQGVRGKRVAGGAINTPIITIATTRIGAGEWVEIKGGGGGAEDALVLSAHPRGQGDVTLTLSQDLAMNHTGSGAAVTSLGRLGIVKAITLQGDPIDPRAPVVSPLELPPGTSEVVFNNLDFTAAQGLTVDSDHQAITVENSTLASLTLGIGTTNLDDLITGNTFTGGVLVNGNGGGQAAGDAITDNTFTGAGYLYMINNDDAAVLGNTFSVSPNSYVYGVVATIINCQSVVLDNNTFTVTNPTASSTDLALFYSSYFPGAMSAQVENNVLNTAGKGVGLETGGPVDALVQGNDFRHNAVGVYLYGDGNTVGEVDLGGGPLGSQGQNNFSTFTDAGVANGHFAITMHNTSANDQVYAMDNTWGVSDPGNLVKDSYVNTNANEAVYSGFTPGTGTIIITITISM